MCGLVSVVSKYKNGMSQKQIDIFTQMLFADEVRGSNGTGIFFNPKQGEGTARILKAPYKSSSFIQTKEYDEVTNVLFKESNFVVGHNRAATRGKIDASCTHPFREGHITLVHNGTLVSHKELHDTYEVDSRAIAHSMEKIGAKETLKKIDGAFALIWFDSQEKTLNFCRNIQRPLHVLETQSTFVLVSEEGLGKWIVERNNEKITNSYVVEPKKHYKFHIEDMSKLVVEPVEYREYVYQAASYKSAFSEIIGESKAYLGVSKFAKHSGFAFGEKVKFKTGDIKGNYLEGDILNYQNLNVHDNIVLADFESQWRIKIYGKKEHLKDIANKGFCSGTINHTAMFNNKVVYHVSAVEVIKKTATILTLPAVVVEDTKLDCEWCKEPFDSLTEVDGWHLCNSCGDSMQNNYGM